MAILTISREFGSGGREIGREVAKSMGYEYIDREKILADIGALGKKWEEWGRDLDEHCPTLWEKYDWSFRGFGALVGSHILEYAAKDKVVIMGRGGNFLLAGVPHAYRVRVRAPMELRIDRIMERESVDSETARWLAEKTDRERDCFIYAIHGKHWDDPSGYDMIFDNCVLTVGEIVSMVREELIRRERNNTAEARSALGMRALAAKIRADIFTDPSFFVPMLDVYYDGQEIVLRGIIHKPEEHKRLENAAKARAGDVPVRCELHYRR